jgi:hypothetical protein
MRISRACEYHSRVSTLVTEIGDARNIVGVIRSGGHLSYGGYDVPIDDRLSEPTSALLECARSCAEIARKSRGNLVNAAQCVGA